MVAISESFVNQPKDAMATFYVIWPFKKPLAFFLLKLNYTPRIFWREKAANFIWKCGNEIFWLFKNETFLCVGIICLMFSHSGNILSIFFPHFLRACWNCVVLILSAVLPLVAHLLSSRSISFGVCIPAPCVSPLYALSGRDWIGTEGEDFNPKSLKTRNKWKSMESRCGIWTTKG